VVVHEGFVGNSGAHRCGGHSRKIADICEPHVVTLWPVGSFCSQGLRLISGRKWTRARFIGGVFLALKRHRHQEHGGADIDGLRAVDVGSILVAWVEVQMNTIVNLYHTRSRLPSAAEALP